MKIKGYCWTLIIAIWVGLGSVTAQTVKWVDQAGGSDGNDGNSEATAYATLQFAVDNSTSGSAGTPSVINVKDGTYEAIGLFNQGGFGTALLIKDLDYLTIQAVAGHSPSVKPSTAGNIVSVSIQNCNHLTIDNIDSDQTTAQFDNWHVFNSTDLTVRNCTFEGGEDGVDFETGHTTALFEKNTFLNITTGSGDEVLEFKDGTFSDIIIQDNFFLNNYRHIRIHNEDGTVSGFIIRRNFMDETNSQEAVRLIGASDILMENNVILNSAQQALYIDDGCSNITVQHNTFFNNGFEEVRNKVTTSDIVIKNNIFYANGTYAALAASVVSLPGEDFNLVYNAGALTESGSQPAVTTFGANTITGMDPLFVSTTPGSEDLQLQPTSPAIAAGDDLGVTDDQAQNPRPQPASTNPDLGAYESGEPAAPGCGDLLFLADERMEFKHHDMSDGAVHSNDRIDFQRGNPSVHSGEITAVGRIEISDRNTVNGDVTSGEDVQLSDGAVVNGTVTEYASVDAIDLPDVADVVYGSDDVEVPRNGSLTLDEGDYRNIKVQENATLTLTGGTYNIRRLDMNNGAVLQVEAAVTMNIDDDLDVNRDATLELLNATATTDVSFNVDGDDVKLRDRVVWVGTILAPQADVVFQDQSFFKGSVCAKRIELHRRTITVHHNSAIPLPKRAAAEVLADGAGVSLPEAYSLEQNYPNPFNPTTTIRFALPEAGPASLKIYNVRGQLVQTLANGSFEAGVHSFAWDGTNAVGEKVASGLYFYQLIAGDFYRVKRMILLK